MGLRSARGVIDSIDPAQAGIVMAILFGIWVIFVGTIFAVKTAHPKMSQITPENPQFVTSDGTPLTGAVIPHQKTSSKTSTPISNPYLTTRVYRSDPQFIQGRAFIKLRRNGCKCDTF